VEAWIEFGRGPLFRLTFSLLVLGLLRLLALSLIGIAEAYRRSSDRIVPWRDVIRQMLGWLLPWRRLWNGRPLYSAISLVWHLGLLSLPLFLSAHVLLWRRSLGLGWPALPQGLADGLTLLTIAGGLALFLGRVLHRGARALSRPQDHAWPLVLTLPFLTGYLCTNAALTPAAYQTSMLVHVYSADLIMALIPFTKVAHCVLEPLSQVVTAVSWKLVPGAGSRVTATLGYADRPSWLEGARGGASEPAAPEQAKEACAK
jgi:nitrate reductase gamma subunit